MTAKLKLQIHCQPDETTCGPTCLHAVYRYFGEDLPLQRVVDEIQQLEDGGTLAVVLGCHALARGYDATIYTYNLQVFDPSWFAEGADLCLKLKEQARAKTSSKLRIATRSYQQFLKLGGSLRFEDLTAHLIRQKLNRNIPILTGLSATYLYRAPRVGKDGHYDDIRGVPEGHFVVLCGYDKDARLVLVADPWPQNPNQQPEHYWVSMDRLINSILLGILTYDANLLLIEPKQPKSPHAGTHRHHQP